jgi:hypothetical protein
LAAVILFTGNSFSQLQSYSPLKHFDNIKNPNDSLFSCGFCYVSCFGIRIKALLEFDSHQSIILNNNAKINGLKLGLDIDRKVKIGFGFYKLDVPIHIERKVTETDTIDRNLSFAYSNLFSEYILYEDFRWELSLPVAIGTGFGNIEEYSHKEAKSRTVSINSTGVLNISTQGMYKIFPWLGMGAGIGYRQMLTRDRGVRESLNSPFYSLRVKLMLGKLYKSVFKKEEVKKEKEEYLEKKQARKEKRSNKSEIKPENNEDF